MCCCYEMNEETREGEMVVEMLNNTIQYTYY